MRAANLSNASLLVDTCAGPHRLADSPGAASSAQLARRAPPPCRQAARKARLRLSSTASCCDARDDEPSSRFGGGV